MTTEELNNLKNKLSSGIAYPENVSYLGNKPNFTRDSFDTLEEMDAAIGLGYIDEGHLSYCKSNGKTYKAIKTEEGGLAWSVFKPGGSGSGISVHTTATYDALEETEKPTDYIEIDDLEHQIEHRSSLDILFSAIRSLQAEVARLKATFELGINSYTGSETAASNIMYDLDDVEEEEPLWAVQESELSDLFTLQFTDQTELIPTEGSTINVASNGDYITISGTANWSPNDNNINLKELRDAKTFLYINSSKKNIKFTFTDDQDESFDVNLSDLIPDVSAKTYSTLLVISKTIKDKTSEEFYGNSFIWITTQELINNNNILETYINPETGRTSERTINLDKNYYLSNVEFTNLKVSKFDFYSKYQDFSDQVDAIRPSNLEEIKYRAAHITIRSVDTTEELDRIINKLQTNELVYVTGTNSLYIISKGNKFKIGSSGNEGPLEIDTMTVKEVLDNLVAQGIITLKGAEYNEETGELVSVSNIELSKISDISFINNSTKEEITYNVDSSGNLVGHVETPNNKKFETIMKDDFKTSLNDTDQFFSRGFINRFNVSQGNGSLTDDSGLYSDRIKIGSYYIPGENDKIFGCSHCFVELENSSQTDYYLDGCYLHYAGPIRFKDSEGEEKILTVTYHLALSGVIPAGGTYLIRGAKVADPNLPSTFIKVNSFDKEWYVTKDTVSLPEEIYDSNTLDPLGTPNYKDNFKKLLKFEYIPQSSVPYIGETQLDLIYGFALTYGQPELLHTTRVINGYNTNQDTALVKPYLIDSCNMFNKTNTYWNLSNVNSNINIVDFLSNSIFKNTFELDPAKQAFQSYSTKDSSRFRGVTMTDYQRVQLDSEYIQFPNSNDVMPVSVYTPKASYEHKNVMTDKTQFDIEKPNMLTVSFGINQLTTRCFNWLSAGYYDEFLWIRKKGDSDWTRIQSYWGNSAKGSGNITRKEFDQEIYGAENNKLGTIRDVVYANPKYKNIFPGNNIYYTSHKCIVNVNNDNNIVDPVEYEYLAGRSNSDGTPMEGHISNIQYFTIYPNTFTPVIYQITDQQGFHWIEYQAWAAAAKKINEKIEQDKTQSYVYVYTEATDITSDNFVQNKYYTSTAQNAEPATEFNNGTTYYTRKRVGIMPILLNTGDMTQNGTRINEWLDYYRAGYCLFDHMEQMNVVGNNDLGNIDETSLGTGDDPGKSNPHFYNICYCYEIPIVENSQDTYLPIFYGDRGLVYLPSIYYFDVPNFRIFMFNSEYKGSSCKELLGSDNYDTYTGLLWKFGDSCADDYHAEYGTLRDMTINDKNSNHYIYEILYKWIENTDRINTKCIFVCHEMPFTVITASNIASNTSYSDRSISVAGDSKGLIGSHTNRVNYVKADGYGEKMRVRSKGTYWLSRLLEHFGIKYCIGGHKHTYACTWPLREYYYYKVDDVWKNSLQDGRMSMPETLENDSVSFLKRTADNTPIVANVTEQTIKDFAVKDGENIVYTSLLNLTKTPITSANNFDFVNNEYKIKGDYETSSGTNLTTITREESTNQNYVIYFMLQATGFKLKSNKELPGPLQKFSQIIPLTSVNASGDKPSFSQLHPMFAKIDLNSNKYDSGLDIRLIAIFNIVPNDKSKVFTQQDAIKTPAPEFRYFDNSKIPYGKDKNTTNGCWSDSDRILNLNIPQ